MCKDCGCSINSTHHHDHHHENPSLKESKTIEVISKILSKNDEEAKHNRAHFNEASTLCINLMSSPGSGKTTLLESTIKALKNELKIAVIEGDLETNNDALRVKNAGAIFLGEYSSEPLGDYFAGPNHVLPTNGTAKFFSALSVDDFIKKSSIISYSREALQDVYKDIVQFAECEQLTAHANSIKVRFEEV